MKAAERRSVMLKCLLNISCVLSVIISVLLLTMPGLIQACRLELERNNKIIELAAMLFQRKRFG